MKTLDETEVVFRGVGEKSLTYTPGEQINFREFLSSTQDIGTATKDAFSKGKETIMELHIQKGTKVVSTNVAEFEVIIGPGQSLEIIDVLEGVDIPIEHYRAFDTQKFRQYVIAVVKNIE